MDTPTNCKKSSDVEVLETPTTKVVQPKKSKRKDADIGTKERGTNIEPAVSESQKSSSSKRLRSNEGRSGSSKRKRKAPATPVDETKPKSGTTEKSATKKQPKLKQPKDTESTKTQEPKPPKPSEVPQEPIEYVIPTAVQKSPSVLFIQNVFIHDESLQDCSSLVKIISKCDSFWPRGDPRVLAKITSDFGRSHYIFINQSIDIPLAVHRFCFMAEDVPKATNEERIQFFESLGIGNNISVCNDHTPQRGCCITRVKYEMIRQYLEKNGVSKKDAAKLALYAMYRSRQDYLGWIKACAHEAMATHFPLLTVAFSFYQPNVVVTNDNRVELQVSLINYIPSTGAWACKFLVTDDNKHNVTATFVTDLRDMTDQGTLTVSVELNKKHKNFKKQLSKKKRNRFTGVYDAHKKCSLRYCDTIPTW